MNANLEELKREAAWRAVDYVRDGMVVGLGTGSTAQYATQRLAELVAGGMNIVGVPTSENIASLARGLGIPLATLDERPQVDITIDGADEIVLATLDAIKGRGGAMLREKIVALASKREIIIVDETKVVQRLGEHDPVPVEVVSFGWRCTAEALSSLGCEPVLRQSGDVPYRTDHGNYILDCRFANIQDPASLAAGIKNITGVVEHGLFIGIVTGGIIAHPDGVQVVEKDE